MVGPNGLIPVCGGYEMPHMGTAGDDTMSRKRIWPHWWDWELDLTPHLLKRMEDRDFNELDL